MGCYSLVNNIRHTWGHKKRTDQAPILLDRGQILFNSLAEGFILAQRFLTGPVLFQMAPGEFIRI